MGAERMSGPGADLFDLRAVLYPNWPATLLNTIYHK